jgi:hypothetical protein
LHEIYERWIGKYERHRLQALSDLKKGLEQKKTKKKKPKHVMRRTRDRRSLR